jgi:hypothetical protein
MLRAIAGFARGRGEFGALAGASSSRGMKQG